MQKEESLQLERGQIKEEEIKEEETKEEIKDYARKRNACPNVCRQLFF